MAGAIAELARKAIVRDFRNIDSSTARVVLVEAGARLLPAFPGALSQSARQQLEKLGVEVRLGSAVTGCDADGVALADGRRIGSRCVLWAAGVMASKAANWLDARADRAGRVVVAETSACPGHPEIFVIGDTALVRDGRRPAGSRRCACGQADGSLCRPVRSRRRLAGKAVAAFPYATSAILPRSAARQQSPILAGSVSPACRPGLLWSLAHLWFLVGFRNRIIVFLDWAWAYATFDRSARLITGRDDR